MEDRKIRVAITHGDTNGVGYELIFKTFAEPEMLELCTPIIYGSPKVAAYHRKALDLQANFSIVNSAEEVRDGRINLLTAVEEEVKVELGMPTPESGDAALKALDKAMTDYREGLFDVLVTAPVNRDNMKVNGFPFSGHTRYIEASAAQAAVDDLLTLENEPVLVHAWIEQHMNPALMNRMKQTIRARRKRHFNAEHQHTRKKSIDLEFVVWQRLAGLAQRRGKTLSETIVQLIEDAEHKEKYASKMSSLKHDLQVLLGKE